MIIFLKKTLCIVLGVLFLVGCTLGGSKESDEPIKVEQPSDDEKEISILDIAKIIVKVLEDKNLEDLASIIHSEKGLLISPYVYIYEDSVVLESDEVAKLLSIEKPYIWGYQDGSGLPIELTPEEYFNRFLRFQKVDEIIVDNVKQRGNMINNIKEVFPYSHVVEFYKKGTEENGNMDWASLFMVFEKNERGEWKLVALVNDQWTI